MTQDVVHYTIFSTQGAAKNHQIGGKSYIYLGFCFSWSSRFFFISLLSFAVTLSKAAVKSLFGQNTSSTWDGPCVPGAPAKACSTAEASMEMLDEVVSKDPTDEEEVGWVQIQSIFHG